MNFYFNNRNNLVLEFSGKKTYRVQTIYHTIYDSIYGKNPYKGLTVQQKINLHRDTISRQVRLFMGKFYGLLKEYSDEELVCDYTTMQTFKLNNKDKHTEFLGKLYSMVIELKLVK